MEAVKVEGWSLRMDLRQCNSYGKYQGRGGWKVEKAEGSRGVIQVFVKTLPVIGVSVLKAQRYEGELKEKTLEEVKRERRVIYTVLGPVTENKRLLGRGYKLSSSPFLPTKTRVIDLEKDESQLWSDLSKDARRIIRGSKVEVRRLTRKGERKEFWKKWRGVSKIVVPGWQRFEDLKECFGEKMWVVGSMVEKKLMAGAVILMAGKRGYYYYSWTDKVGRKLGGQYKLMWEIIKKLREERWKKFDLEGIEDERWPRKSWRGFSYFKNKFGGKEVAYPGSFVKWF